MSNLQIDLNCDMGESYGNYKIGNDDQVMPYITSCNVACGFHGGDPLQIEKTIKNALKYGLQIGAHPGLPDLQGFGRRRMQIPADELRAIIKYQIAAIKGITESLGGKLTYVKPHGALYNMAADDAAIAQSIVQAIQEIDEAMAFMGLAGSEPMEQTAKKAGIRFIAEAFADRRYTPNGRLQSRSIEGAVIHDVQKAAAQVLALAKDKQVTSSENTILNLAAQSICIHGDNPKIGAILQAIDIVLSKNKISKHKF
ncbi:MAG: 5-oxoprolinase subunit PxpA [Saprospiraceae bacterium]